MDIMCIDLLSLHDSLIVTETNINKNKCFNYVFIDVIYVEN